MLATQQAGAGVNETSQDRTGRLDLRGLGRREKALVAYRIALRGHVANAREPALFRRATRVAIVLAAAHAGVLPPQDIRVSDAVAAAGDDILRFNLAFKALVAGPTADTEAAVETSFRDHFRVLGAEAVAAGRRDLERLAEEGASMPATSALWPHGQPAMVSERWNASVERLNHAGLGHLARWYGLILVGREPDETWYRVAQLPVEAWQSTETLAHAIDRIEAAVAVGRSAGEAARLIAGRPDHVAPIGHNRPPEPLDDAPVGPAEIDRLEEAVATLAREAEAPAPDAEAVAQAREQTAGFLRRAVGWLAAKLDVAADAFFKAVGQAAGASAGLAATGVSTVWLMDLANLLRPLLDAVERWLALL